MDLLFDKLAYLDRLTRAGINEDQARAFSEALDQALKESVATKQDIDRLDNRVEMLRKDLEIAVRDLKIWVGGMLVVLFGALVTARFFIK